MEVRELKIVVVRPSTLGGATTIFLSSRDCPTRYVETSPAVKYNREGKN